MTVHWNGLCEQNLVNKAKRYFLNVLKHFYIIRWKLLSKGYLTRSSKPLALWKLAIRNLRTGDFSMYPNSEMVQTIESLVLELCCTLRKATRRRSVSIYSFYNTHIKSAQEHTRLPGKQKVHLGAIVSTITELDGAHIPEWTIWYGVDPSKTEPCSSTRRRPQPPTAEHLAEGIRVAQLVCCLQSATSGFFLVIIAYKPRMSY